MLILYQYFVGIWLLLTVALLLWRPRDGLVSVLIVLSLALDSVPFYLQDNYPKGMGMAMLGLASLVIFTDAFFSAPLASLRSLCGKYQFALYGFCLLLWGMLLVSPVQEYGLEKAVRFTVRVMVPMLALCAILPYDRRKCEVIIWSLVFASVASGICLLAFSDVRVKLASIGDQVGSITVGRIIGAGLFVSSAAACFGRELRPLTRLCFSLIAVVLVCLYIPTGEKGPLLGILCSFLAVAVLRNSDVRLKLLQIGITLAILSGGLVMIARSDTDDQSLGLTRLRQTLLQDGLATSEHGRLERFNIAWGMFVDTVGFGAGTGSFAKAMNRDREWPHNIVLEVLAELGIIGFCIICFMVVITAIAWWRLVRGENVSVAEICVGSLWIYFLVNAMVSYDISSNHQLWVCMLFPHLLARADSSPHAQDLPAYDAQGRSFSKEFPALAPRIG